MKVKRTFANNLFWISAVVSVAVSFYAVQEMSESACYAAAFFMGVSLSLYMFDNGAEREP